MVEWVALRPIFDVCTRDMGYKGGGEAPGAVAETGSSVETDEGHYRRDFGGGKGAAVIRIRQTW